MITGYSLSYHDAPLDARAALSAACWGERLADVPEWFTLSTCNRFELVIVDETDLGLDIPSFAGLEAAAHLCRVAAGLESMVLGEPQILGQLKAAYSDAVAAGTLGPTLDAVLRTAIHVGKRARAETDISRGAVSLSSIAINMAQEQIGSLRDKTVVVIGVGDMGQLALKALDARRVPTVRVVNRTLERAETAANDHPDWEAYPLSDLPAAIEGADVIITAVGVPDPIITPELLGDATPLLIDMGVPRNVSPLVDAPLIDIDALHTASDHTRCARQQEIPAVEAMIEQALEMLAHELRGLRTRPLLVHLRQQAEEIRRAELERTGVDDPALRDQLEHMTRALVNKLMHAPTMYIRDMAYEDDSDDLDGLVRDLFAL